MKSSGKSKKTWKAPKLVVAEIKSSTKGMTGSLGGQERGPMYLS